MIPDRRRKNYTAAVLVPLVAAAVTAWSEHRTAQNKERQDAAYAVTAPVLRDLQLEQAKLAARVEILTKLLSDHVIRHPRAETEPAPVGRRRAGSAGLGSLGAGARGAAAGQDQVNAANQLKAAPALHPIQRSIPDSPEAALLEMKR